MHQTQLTIADLDFTTVTASTTLRPSVLTKYLNAFDLERACKNPATYAKWLKENGIDRRPAIVYRELHQIYLAWERTATKKLVGICGIVPEYLQIATRGKFSERDPYFCGFFAGDLVHPDHQGRGIDSLMIQHRIDVTQQYATLTGLPAVVYTLSVDSRSVRYMARFGFKVEGLRSIPNQKVKKWLLRLQINPDQRTRLSTSLR